MISASGAVLLIRSYDPYGSGMTSYGFAGEWTDQTGLQNLRARYYMPQPGRFLTRDIYPGTPNQPETINRYSYSSNNPLKYTDPSGHFPLLITAAIGVGIGFSANYAIQVYKNMQEGKSLPEAASWSNMNKKELTVATVGGFVGGLTMGAVTAVVGATGLTAGISTAVSGIGGGALANIMGGQAEAITDAAYDQVVNNTRLESTTDGRHLVYFDYNGREFYNDARSKGFLDQQTIKHDAVIGGLVGGATAGLQSIVADAGTPELLYLGRQPASWIRPVSQAIDYFGEVLQQCEEK